MNLARIVLITFLSSAWVSCGGGKHMPTKENSAPVSSSTSSTPSSGRATSSQGPTYNEDIHPIFEKYCSACHRPGSGLPDWLQYSQAYAKRNKIMENDVIKRIMPPKGAPQLPESEIQKIKQWIEAGAPEKKATAQSVTTQTVQGKPPTIPAESTTTPAVTSNEQITAPMLFCQEITRYSSQRIRSNRILSMTLPADIRESSISLTKLTFGLNDGASSVVNHVLLQTHDSQLEVCGVHLSNKDRCEISQNFVSKDNAQMKVECITDTPVIFQMKLTNGKAQVSCKSESENIAEVYDRCVIVR